MQTGKPDHDILQYGPQFDFVTVTFTDELPLLALQAMSVAKYVERDCVGTIFIVVNDPDFHAVERTIKQKILWRYKHFKNKVQILNGALPNFDEGWKSQQVLKLAIARKINTEAFVILDSKNHFIRPFGRQQVIAPDNKLYSVRYDVYEPYQENLKRACRYFGYDGDVLMQAALPTTTPYFMVSDLARNLIDYIEAKEGKSFEEAFHALDLYTEFYCYYAFLLSQGHEPDDLYTLQWGIASTIFANAAKDAKLAESQLQYVDEPDIYAMGVHREVLKSMEPAIMEMVYTLWVKFELIQDQWQFEELVGKNSLLNKWQYYLKRLFNRKKSSRLCY